jgi:hypothetical protein
MNWFLSLFPQYRELRRMLQEAADSAMKFQDQNDALIKHNTDLLHSLRVADADRDQAVKAVANVFAQLAGHLPPYREAYSIERRPEAETGPVPTNRVYARDVVREGSRQFQDDLRGVKREDYEAVDTL